MASMFNVNTDLKLSIDTGFCIWLSRRSFDSQLNSLLAVSKLLGFKMSTSGANANHDYLSYRLKERASLLEALLGSCSQEPLSPIMNALPMGPPVVSPMIKLESSVDMLISGNPTLTCSGCQLFSPLALPPPETNDICIAASK